MAGDLTEEEFTRRFVAYMVQHAGFTAFDDGTAVKDYANEVAESYWIDLDRRSDGPEDCAASDMEYWGEE